MKSICLTIMLLCLSIFSFSQKINLEDIIKLLKAGDAQKAKEATDLSIKDNELITNPRTWYYRAVTYHSIYESPLQEVKTLAKQPLTEAYNSYFKTMQLDKNKEFNSDVIKALSILASQMVYEGIQYFNTQDYTNALSCFENNISINKLPAINQIDTIVLYNAALSAEKGGKNQLAIDYYNQLIKLEYGGANICLDLAKLYKKEGKINEYILTLENGLKAYPTEDIGLISELINHYLEVGKNDEAMSYVDKGIFREPKNQAFHFVKGSLFEQKGELIKAETEYLKAIEIDPEYNDALFNLGALYFNQATDIIKVAKTKDEQSKSFALYTKAQPHLEKLNILTPGDVQIMKMLKTIYTLLKIDDKLLEINKKLEKS
ncbi:MAG: tetratricopeptide repeat protein [Bacteroidia bacterium]|nr:tetratricopeptide repeat protein [Bacteroidia bacterium]